MLCLFELYALDIASVLSMSNDSLKLVKDHEPNNNMSQIIICQLMMDRQMKFQR